jgi:hypothetical protein
VAWRNGTIRLTLTGTICGGEHVRTVAERKGKTIISHCPSYGALACEMDSAFYSVHERHGNWNEFESERNTGTQVIALGSQGFICCIASSMQAEGFADKKRFFLTIASIFQPSSSMPLRYISTIFHR